MIINILTFPPAFKEETAPLQGGGGSLLIQSHR
jgi:hypothetical protein